ncbi:MAG: T9SS type A sorting domain-containing protein [Bacteroidetes bacterium]|nr:T9SS type A sorting domain-containing protein [Bacteroidota bacterium]
MKKILFFCFVFLVTQFAVFGQTENLTGKSEGNQHLLPSAPTIRQAPLVPMCGSYNVGAGQTYTTLTVAITDLNSRGVSCAVTLVLTDNSYASETFPISINTVAGSSIANRVTIKPGAGKTPVISGSSATAILILNGSKYITIDGSNSGGTDKSLTLTNTNTAANTCAIELMNSGTPSSYDIIKNCIIEASSQVTVNTYGIFLDNTGGGYDSITISNNTIRSARIGIQFQGVGAAAATNGRIINNIIGWTTDAQAIQFKGIFLRQSDNTLIEGNEIMGAPSGNTNNAQSGIWIPGGATNTMIRRNKVHDWYFSGTNGNAAYGIYYGAAAATVTEISNNAITNIKGDGNPNNQDKIVAGIYINSGGNLQIYHNSVWLTGATLRQANTGTSACLSIFSGVTNLNVRNNIFKNSMTLVSGTTGNTYAVYCASANTCFTTINYNDYYDDGVGANIGYLGGNQPLLANWQAATLQDIYSLSIDPLFTGPNDLHTTVAGLAKKGVTVLLTPIDLAGTPRTDPPDIGAYQFSANPTATTTAATAILTTTASLNGFIYPNFAIVTPSFEYGLTTAYGTTVPAVPSTVLGNTPTTITTPVGGLTPCTLYHYRAKGTSGGVTVYGNDMTFNTGNLLSTATTVIASGVLPTSALINGLVNANNFGTVTTSFDWGPTWSYGTNVAGSPPTVTGNTNVPVQASLTSLTPGTLYHYRVNGTNACGTTNGTDMTFTTPFAGPTVVTLPASGVGSTSATLNGTINPNGNSTTATFKYGLTVAYGSTIPGIPSPITGNSDVPVSAVLTGLLTNTTYHYQLCGTNALGTNCGTDQTFYTGCIAAGAAGSITGPINACQGGSGYVYTLAPIPNATGYNWTLPVGGTITTGANTNSITVSYSPTAVSGYVYVYGTSICGNGSPSQLMVTVNSPPVPTLVGPTTACYNVPGYVYTTQSGMANYYWTVNGGVITAGGTPTSNTATVTWTMAGNPNICVAYTNAAGCMAPVATCLQMFVPNPPVPTITGPAPACTGAPGAVYITQASQINYTWSVSSGGTITGGSTTNMITVTWNTPGAQSVSVNYANSYGCTAATPTVFPVTVNTTTIPTITGSGSLCANSGYYNYSTQTGMNNYIWTVTGGQINNGQGTNQIQVIWPSAGNFTVSVIFINPSGCVPPAPTVIPVTVNALPDAAGTISGTSAVCAGATGVAYSVPPISNALTYVWTLPGGATIASGSGTNSITVDFANDASSGNVTVYGNNLCGNGSVSPPFPLTVTQLPNGADLITGQPDVCPGETGVIYGHSPILNATDYHWTVPSGFNIVSGANTNIITVDIALDAVSGFITVFGSNECGNGGVSTAFGVMVNPIPPAPVIQYVELTGELSSDAPSGNQWYFEGALIPGATAQTYTPLQTGHYTDIVTINGCNSPVSNDIYFLMTGIEPLFYGSNVSVYPNPGDGLFTLIISTKEQVTLDLSVVNNLGVTIYEKKDINIKGAQSNALDLRSQPDGVYSVILKNNNIHILKKIVISR